MRKAFNFYKSYYEVASELSEKDRAIFLWAILQKQFEGIEPNLTGIPKLAYISQKHNIDAQIKGYEDKTGNKLTPYIGGAVGGAVGGSVQGEGEEEEKVKEQLVNIDAVASSFKVITKEDIDLVYNSYPNNCPYSQRTLGKNSKDKDKIKTLLKAIPLKDLLGIIKGSLLVSELSNRGEFKVSLKNFGTFLNNLPILEDLRQQYSELSVQGVESESYEAKIERTVKQYTNI